MYNLVYKWGLMTAFLLAVLSSIVAAIIIIIASRVKSKYLLSELFAKISKSELLVKFNNREAAKKSIQKNLLYSSFVYVFAGRGNELRREPFEELFHKRPSNKRVDLQILLPNPVQDDSRINWLAKRESELSGFDSSYKVDTLKREIEASIQYLNAYVKKGYCTLKLFSFPHVGRFIITEDFLFLTPYSDKEHARDCPVYKFKKGNLYYNYLRLFNQISAISRPVG